MKRKIPPAAMRERMNAVAFETPTDRIPIQSRKKKNTDQMPA